MQMLLHQRQQIHQMRHNQHLQKIFQWQNLHQMRQKHQLHQMRYKQHIHKILQRKKLLDYVTALHTLIKD